MHGFLSRLGIRSRIALLPLLALVALVLMEAFEYDLARRANQVTAEQEEIHALVFLLHNQLYLSRQALFHDAAAVRTQLKENAARIEQFLGRGAGSGPGLEAVATVAAIYGDFQRRFNEVAKVRLDLDAAGKAMRELAAQREELSHAALEALSLSSAGETTNDAGTAACRAALGALQARSAKALLESTELLYGGDLDHYAADTRGLRQEAGDLVTACAATSDSEALGELTRCDAELSVLRERIVLLSRARKTLEQQFSLQETALTGSVTTTCTALAAHFERQRRMRWTLLLFTVLGLLGASLLVMGSIVRPLNRLRRGEQLAREVIEHMGDGVAIYDVVDDGRDFIINHINRVGVKMANQSLETLKGRRIRDAFPNVEEMGLFVMLQQVWRSGQPENLPLTYYSDEHQSVWVENYVFRLDAAMVVAVYADVTERKKAEEALRLNEERLESLLKLNAMRGMGEQDLYAYAIEEVVRLTRSEIGYFHYVGKEQGEIRLGIWSKATVENCRAVADEHYPLAAAGIWADCQRLGKAVIHNDYPVRPDRKGLPEGHIALRRHMSVPIFGDQGIVAIAGLGNKAAPYDESDVRQVTLFFASLQDILRLRLDAEERLDLERQLRQSQKMEAMGAMAGGLAHDFNNILAIIYGNVELAEEDLAPGSAVRETMGDIHLACDRAMALVSGILAFSRRGEGTFEEIDAAVVARETARLLKASMPANVGLEVDIEEREVRLMGDSTQIGQVIMNLAVNALHAMEPDGGVLGIALRRVEGRIPDSPREHEAHVLLRVRDSGIGIPPLVMERIFEPYFTTKSEGKGTGLGLAIVHGIVKAHGGEIAVSSTVGEGSVFSVRLPLEGNVAGAEAKTEDALPQGRGERILLVEDEEMLRRLTVTMLTRLGYVVEAAASAQEGLHILEKNPQRFDLLFTDYAMPGMTGADLVRAVFALRPDFPVIFCTGFAMSLAKVREEIPTIRAFLLKPYDKRQLAVAFHEALHPAVSGGEQSS